MGGKSWRCCAETPQLWVLAGNSPAAFLTPKLGHPGRYQPISGGWRGAGQEYITDSPLLPVLGRFLTPISWIRKPRLVSSAHTSADQVPLGPGDTAVTKLGLLGELHSGGETGVVPRELHREGKELAQGPTV